MGLYGQAEETSRRVEIVCELLSLLAVLGLLVIGAQTVSLLQRSASIDSPALISLGEPVVGELYRMRPLPSSSHQFASTAQ